MIFRGSCIKHRGSCIKHQGSRIKDQVSRIKDQGYSLKLYLCMQASPLPAVRLRRRVPLPASRRQRRRPASRACLARAWQTGRALAAAWAPLAMAARSVRPSCHGGSRGEGGEPFEGTHAVLDGRFGDRMQLPSVTQLVRAFMVSRASLTPMYGLPRPQTRKPANVHACLAGLWPQLRIQLFVSLYAQGRRASRRPLAAAARPQRRRPSARPRRPAAPSPSIQVLWL